MRVRSVQSLAWQQFDGRSARRSEGLRSTDRNVMGVTVIVIFEILENVADVKEGIAIEANFHECRLHAGKDASDFAFVNAANERKFFFSLDVNFD